MCHDDHTVLPVRQTDHVLVDTITLRGDQIYYTQISEQRIEQTIAGDCTGPSLRLVTHCLCPCFIFVCLSITVNRLLQIGP